MKPVLYRLAALVAVFVSTLISFAAPAPPVTELCGTMAAWEKTPEGKAFLAQLKLVGTCPTNGLCDGAPSRDGKIPIAATPWKIVPVRFQVFANDDGSNPAATATEMSNQMWRVNQDFVQSRIYFVYSARTNNSTLYRNCPSNSEPAMKMAFAESPNTQINIFVTAYQGFNNCGIATFPWQASSLTSTGGLVLQDWSIAPARFGSASNFINCLSHELGHQLGLLHTFRGVLEVGTNCNNCRELVGRSAADGDLAGDFCSDTPPDPGFQSTFAPCSFPATNDSCNGMAFSTNVVLLDNIMSYYIGCATSFTPQQRGRMHCWSENRLSSWLLSDFVNPQIAITAPTNGASFMAFGAIEGWATDNYVIDSIGVQLRENDPSGVAHRWWNGTNWQASAFTLPATRAGTNWTLDASVMLPPMNSGISYLITATVVDGKFNTASASVTVSKPIETLVWDPGLTHEGTQVRNSPHAYGGPFIFKIVTQGTSSGVWRTALNVTSNEAHIWIQYNNPPTTGAYNFRSLRDGSDGFCLAQAGQFSPAQDWYYLLNTTAGSQWNLVSGEAYVQQLPALAADASSGTNGSVMGAESMRFYRTTISLNTLAWRLGLNGLTNGLLVKKTSAPHPYNTTTYDLYQFGQMLVVPTYLNIGDQYFVGVIGEPGQIFSLDSRQQIVTDLAFNSNTNFALALNSYGYVTFRVPVPVQQIAWQMNLTLSSGDASVAARQGSVPNEFNNAGYSEVASPTADSLTLVPPTLTDGTWYLTVYGTAPYSCALTNGQPVITDVHYVFTITNDAPNRAGWRFYRVVNTAEQLGTLGWDLFLQNHVPGTEIALRRNAVPGRWTYRDYPTWNYTTPIARAHVDYSGPNSFLQRPGHQADVWYIGVYQPNTALGPFILTGQELTGPLMAFDDGTGTTNTVVDQPAGKFQYYRIDVPVEAFGWDLRIINVTSGDPRLVVRRDQLPDNLSTHESTGCCGWSPTYSATWPSGYQVAAWYDWTGYANDPGPVNRYGHILTEGKGNWLEAGTYYVGILNGSGSASMSYQLVSRGIGTNFAIPILTLPMSNGLASVSNLVPREAAYYRIDLPSNTPSLKLRMNADAGDALLSIQRAALPHVGTANGLSPQLGVSGGERAQKAGHEQYAVLPLNGQSNVSAGSYYVAIVSEGVNPGAAYNVIGTGTSSFTLATHGSFTATNLGTVDPTGAADLTQNEAIEGAELRTYQFTVPSNTLALEVRLENRIGTPYMTLRAGALAPNPLDGFANDGGQNYTWQSPTLINVANPVAGLYTLVVQGASFNSVYSNASYTVRVHAINPLPVAFDGGASSVANQEFGAWRYFSFTVPSNAFGWDLRLVNVSAGDPRLVVRRETAPDGLSTHTDCCYWDPAIATAWPSNWQVAVGNDWTGLYANNGANEYGRLLEVGLGNPLEPGRYIAGVFSGGSGGPLAMSYTLLSRGIGTNVTIPITPLAFAGGTVISNGLPVREAAYYSVVIPSNTATWKLRVATNAGDVMLVLQRSYLPNTGASPYSEPWNVSGGVEVQRLGNEHYTALPPNGQTNIPAGIYYLAVIGEGQNPNYPAGRIGTNTSSFTLTSLGELVVTNLGTVDNSGATDLVQTDAIEGTELRAYQFMVPAGTLSLQVSLENTIGYPYMSLRAGERLPAPLDGYANDGGYPYTWQHAALITIANPTNGTFTLMVQAANYSGTYSNASYTVRVHAQGTIPVAFDGGSTSIAGQAAGSWQYFLINVPSNAFGWDLRLTNVTSGDPRLSVKRGALPDGLSTHTESSYWYFNRDTSWPSNYQIAAVADWTGYNATNGANEYGRVLQVGMGNPLSPGWYYVGVINGSGSTPMSYTLASRGIGTNLSIPIVTLPFVGTVTNTGLLAREGAYYCVVVPSNTLTWKARLALADGDASLLVQKDFLPSIAAYYSQTAYSLQGGKKMQKPGNEHYFEMPVTGGASPFVAPGTYYLAVISEGMNPNPALARIGSGATSFALHSEGSPPIVNLGTAGGADLTQAGVLEGAEMKAYTFDVPPNVGAIEVRLENRSGNPTMTLRRGARLPSSLDYFAADGGETYQWQAPALITLPNPTATNYSLNVFADYQGGPNTYVDAGYTVVVDTLPVPPLMFDALFNTADLKNYASNTLANGASFFYRVEVPTNIDGAPVLGWKLDLSATTGTPSVRVRKDSLPDNVFGTSPFTASQAVIVPDYLTPGTWFVEVRASGITSYRLTSSALRLERPAWQMPAIGQSVITPGLPPSGPLFGDSGVDTNGVALPGDQGVDLEQGSFHFYAVLVPSNNVGVLRTRLDAISGDPNLYIRTNKAPTLTHAYSGGGGYTWDRALTANLGSEYGNWVPNNTRFEFFLTPGTWYLAVQAAGNANVRYRLRVSTGDVQDLALNSATLEGQTLAGGDWRYYRVYMPSNAPTNWTVTFNQQVGDAVMYIRDTAPPGQFSVTYDYRDWSYDNKNHGPYPNYDPQGSYTFACPPLRPGTVYYIGFRAVNDATFTVRSTTNGPQILHTNVIPFYGGFVTNQIPPNGVLRYRIDVPEDAYRWIHTSTHSNAVSLWIDQGSVPTMTTVDHVYWLNQQNTSFNRYLRNPGDWPWQPGYMYFLTVSNTSGITQPFSFRMDGRNAVTDDNDGDGLPDAWELTYFPSIYSYNGTHDPDGDGINNADEYADGTNPADNTSFRARLTLVYSHGSVTRNPLGTPRYALGTTVTLTASPEPGYVFMGWGGDTNGLMNPLDVVMNTNKTIIAIFGADTSLPNADYRFQNTLASSIGTPPDLQNIGAGNSFQSEIVDGFARVVYRFPQGNGLLLLPTTNTIPSNVWSMVLLFRFDAVSGYRRVVDTKLPPGENGLYVYNGKLNFYPVASSAGAPIAASNYVQVVLTRDETNLVRGYVNGAQQFAALDDSQYLVIGGTNSGLRFFIDNAGENAGGAVARIRLFNTVLTPEQVPLLDRLPGAAGGGPLQFATPTLSYSNGVLRVSASLTPNFNYQIQASTNLTNWATIQNINSASSPVLFTDTNASNYLNRFYRGVTP